jgi:hypothetical protein
MGLITFAAIAADVSNAVRRLISRRVKYITLSPKVASDGGCHAAAAFVVMLRWKMNPSHFLIAAGSGISF